MYSADWFIPTKHEPGIGDVIEGRVEDGEWSDGGRWVHGCVVRLNPMAVTTYNGTVEVTGRFIGTIIKDNSDLDFRTPKRIWVVLPLGRTAKGHLANMPKTGFAVEVCVTGA